jgi:hypothetical protein
MKIDQFSGEITISPSSLDNVGSYVIIIDLVDSF